MHRGDNLFRKVLMTAVLLIETGFFVIEKALLMIESAL